MGYEAYKLTAKFQNISMEDITGALQEMGAAPIEKFGGTTTMELPTDNGVLDLVLKYANHINTRFSPSDKIELKIRFAKPNNVKIASDVIKLLKKLMSRFDTLYIRDNETTKDIDISDAAALIKSITYAKYDFEYYFPMRPRQKPIRCREVFCGCRTATPVAREAALF